MASPAPKVMPPLSQYQATRLLHLISSNCSRVREHDHVEQDVWARANPPLRGIAFTSRRQAYTDLAAGHLCAVPASAPDLFPSTAPSPPASPSHSLSTIPSSKGHGVYERNPLADFSPAPRREDADRGAIGPVPNPPVVIQRVESDKSRTSRISSAPSFGKLTDPLSAGSFQGDPPQVLPEKWKQDKGIDSTGDLRRATAEYEEFGNEALITHVFDDLDDEYDFDTETANAIFQAIGSGLSESKPLPRTRSLSSVPSATPQHDVYFFPPVENNEPTIANAYLDDTRAEHSIRHIVEDEEQKADAKFPHDADFNVMAMTSSHPISSAQDLSSSLQPHFSFPPVEKYRVAGMALPSSSASPFHSRIHSSEDGSRSTPVPPPPPLYSSNSLSDSGSPSQTAPVSPHFFSKEFATDSFPDGIPLPPVTPPSAPMCFDVFDSLSSEMEILHIAPGGPIETGVTSPVTNLVTSTESITAPDMATTRTVPSTTSHPKTPSHQANRSLDSTSDYFSCSEYTGISDHGRRMDSSVEVESSDEEFQQERDELDDEELRQAVMSSSVFESTSDTIHEVGAKAVLSPSTLPILNHL